MKLPVDLGIDFADYAFRVNLDACPERAEDWARDDERLPVTTELAKARRLEIVIEDPLPKALTQRIRFYRIWLGPGTVAAPRY